MSYPRNRKEIITINGVFDPCQDPIEMSELWTLAGPGWFAGGYGVVWTQPAAPGGLGGYAHKLFGDISGVIGMYGTQGICPFTNNGFQYFYSPVNSHYFKCVAEFRLYIEEDHAPTESTTLGMCGAFIIDGNSHLTSSTTTKRLAVCFNQAKQKIAITHYKHGSTSTFRPAHILAEYSWAGSIDTWYDIKIEWSHNWYATPRNIDIEVFVNKISVLTYTVDFPQDWRCDDGNYNDYRRHSIQGRCGPGIFCEQEVGASTHYEIHVYFKDILITQEFKTIDWKATDSLIQKGMHSSAQLLLTSDWKDQFGEGSDLKIWKRLKISNNWSSKFRGIIREVTPRERKYVSISAEGYESILFNEKTENISHTTQTAGTIVADAINNPDKGEFDVSTYFDTTTVTYNRSYMHTKKMDNLMEMTALEGFILYVDWRNNWHFESYRTVAQSIHLQWGISRILEIEISQIFARRPNIIRVIGKGVIAEREIAVDNYSSGSNIVRNFNRLDLDSQDEVDEALDLYTSYMREPLKVVILKMRANHDILKGSSIRVTSAMHGLFNHQFKVTAIKTNKVNQMSLTLLENRPHTNAVIADTATRSDTKESEMFPSDYIADNPTFNVEGTAKVLIYGYMQVIRLFTDEKRRADVVIVDGLMDALVELWNGDGPTEPLYIGYGTGTGETKFNDNALENETARVAITTQVQEVNVGRTIYPTEKFRQIRLDTSNVMPNITLSEIGLFNASSGGKMFARAVFPSLTDNELFFRVRLTVIPLPGYAFLTIWGLEKIMDWFETGASVNPTHINHIGTDDFLSPTMYSVPATSWCPASAAAGTLTKTKLYDRNMIKFEFDYADYDFAGDKGGGSDNPEKFLALTKDSVGGCLACISHRSTKDMSDFDNSSCKWILWLKFVAGKIEYD